MPSEVKAEVVEAEDVIVVVVEAEAEVVVVVEAGKDGQFVLHQKIVLAAMKGKNNFSCCRVYFRFRSDFVVRLLGTKCSVFRELVCPKITKLNGALNNIKVKMLLGPQFC